MPVSRSNGECFVLYSLNLMYECNLRRARTLTQGQLTIKFAVCESEEWATGKGLRRICRWGVWWWFMISHSSIINVPLSVWPTSEKDKLATGLFTSSDVLMEVKLKVPSLSGDLQLGHISAGICRKWDISNQGLNIGWHSRVTICRWKKKKMLTESHEAFCRTALGLRFSICNLDFMIYNQLGTVAAGAPPHRQWIIILFAVRFLTTRCHWILCAGDRTETPRYKQLKTRFTHSGANRLSV